MDTSRGPQLEAVILGFLALCTIAVSLRTYTMGFILKRLFLEDYLAILALVRTRQHSKGLSIFSQHINQHRMVLSFSLPVLIADMSHRLFT